MAIRKVGDCRILGELGKGGMATVFRAVHETLQREVAIKELPADIAKNKEALSRFMREAMAMAGFHHQHIVTLYDLVEKNDGLYMVMELVDGPTLAMLLKDGTLPPDVTAVLAHQVSLALEHAHFRRIVHRDLKPSNIMVAKSGEVKLMDFGIAITEDLDRLTKTGLAVGTPAYMSPEQVLGKDVDARSDLYSLGVVLYECLSGTKAFTGPSAGDLFAKITSSKYVALKKAAPDAPAELRAIVERCLAKKADERWQDATELRHALEKYLARHVVASQSAVLVSFLHSRNEVSDSEMNAALSGTQLTALSKRPEPEAHVGWFGALLVLAGLAAGAAATRELWWTAMLRALSVPWLR